MEEYSGEPIAIVDQTQKRRLPIQEVAPPEKCRHIGDYVVETKKGTAPHEENSPCNTTEQQRWGYATSMRFVSFSAF